MQNEGYDNADLAGLQRADSRSFDSAATAALSRLI